MLQLICHSWIFNERLEGNERLWMQGDSSIAAIFKMLNESFKMFFFASVASTKGKGKVGGGGEKNFTTPLKTITTILLVQF